MRASRYFSELSSNYAYEIEDLTWDSGGGNVLGARLKAKRGQFAELLAMCEFDPVMVAPALHGAFRFVAPEALAQLVESEPDAFPEWDAIKDAIELEPWAEPLVKRALAAPGGEQFMLVAAGLEYLQSSPGPAVAAPEAESANEDAEEGDEDGEDLAEAGEDYLADQGFDRRS